jgi:hypothetical protein
MRGGANSRLFEIRSAARRVVLKCYFHHQSDPRDRLAAEFAFASFVWGLGFRHVPPPLARDDARHQAVYGFIDGRPLEPSEVTASAVAEALAFFKAVNAARTAPAALELPPGSEACFSLAEHLACVERRVTQLETMGGEADTPAAVREFVVAELVPTWRRVARDARDLATLTGWLEEAPLAPAARCLSPSDFGFHNALRTAAGPLAFLDFEYAGWDDPAKTVCDFFCQPALPAPRGERRHFSRSIADAIGGDETLEMRCRVLWPVYQVKWCAILLNALLPTGRARRRFALRGHERPAESLARARATLRALTAWPHDPVAAVSRPSTRVSSPDTTR